MITNEKIEQWIIEVEERPNSAPLILRYIANRLRTLNERNEELLEENIALRTRERVKEHEQRIAHLEYQLDLLKRQSGGELPREEDQIDPSKPSPEASVASISLLVFDSLGHMLHFELEPENLVSGAAIAHLALEALPAGEPVGLLGLPSTEELLLVYTSGRVEPLAIGDIPAVRSAGSGAALSWQKDRISDVHHAGDTLACLSPISNLALSDYFVQVSRRGYLKKLSTTMAASILSNRYIGTGVKQPADQTFILLLCREEDRITLVSKEGYLLCVKVSDLPFSIEEAMRIGPSDHLVGALISPPDHDLLVMTENGKIIHRTDDYLDNAAGYKLKGKGLYSQRRREEGVRVISTAAVREGDWGAVLHGDGRITLHNVRELLGSGTLQDVDKVLSFCSFTTPTSQG